MNSVSKPAGRTNQQQRRSLRTRERILAAAIYVFARKGFHGTRVSDIAEHASMAYGLVYHHFKNKEEILAAIYSERWGQYVTYLNDLCDAPLAFPEKMAKIVHFWVTTYRQEPHLTTVLVNEITRSYEFLESHDIGTILVAFDAVQRMIDEGKETGYVSRNIDSRLATYIVFGAAEMILTGYVMGTLRQADDSAYDQQEQQILKLLLDGLTQKSENPS